MRERIWMKTCCPLFRGADDPRRSRQLPKLPKLPELPQPRHGNRVQRG